MAFLNFWYDLFFQIYFIPKPELTERNLPSQSGRVCIVTGGYAGIGKELARILCLADCTVYIAGRSRDKYEAAVQDLQSGKKSSDGRLEFLELDLGDLESVKKAARTFMQREQRLDVLVNNAGVMVPPIGSKTIHNHELQMGTNVLGPWLFTELLTPLIQKTAKDDTHTQGSTRVLWASSLAHIGCPKGGVAFDTSGNPVAHNDRYTDYAQSKAANILLAQEYQKRCGSVETSSGEKRRIVSVSFHPGALKSELQRHQYWYEDIVVALVCHPAVYGAYTELWAGWSDEVGKEENAGKYVVPWGRFGMVKESVERGTAGPKLWEWCENQARDFLP